MINEEKIFNLYEYYSKDECLCHGVGMRGKDDGEQKVIREE